MTERVDVRQEAACADGSTEVQSTLRRARKLFAGMADALEAEIDRLQFKIRADDDEDRIKLVMDLIRSNQKALQTVLDIEVKLMRADDRETGRNIIDLEGARAEINRRLDRLAA